MTEFWQQFFNDIAATSFAEWVAVLLAIAYLLLAMKERIECWYAAFVSTLIYSVLFFDVNLYMESLLNLYYLAMAVYGWFQWRQNKEVMIAGVDNAKSNRSAEHQTRPITCWSLRKHLTLISVAILVVILNGYWLSRYTDQSFPYLDSMTTWFAVITTWMVAKKELNNWLYWIVIDSVSIWLYLQKGLALTAVLFVGYVLIAIVGYFLWRREYTGRQMQAVPIQVNS